MNDNIVNNIKFLIVCFSFIISCFIVSSFIVSCYVPEMIIDSAEYRKYKNAVSYTDISEDFYIINSERGIIIRTKDDFLYFRRSSYRIDDKSLTILEKIKNLLEENQNIKIIVEGHSDSTGGEGALFDNVILSKNRSEAVINKLKSMGITEERLISRYYSDYIPYYSDSSYDLKRSERNRRAEFIFKGGEKDLKNYQNQTKEIFSKVLEIENLSNDYNQKKIK